MTTIHCGRLNVLEREREIKDLDKHAEHMPIHTQLRSTNGSQWKRSMISAGQQSACCMLLNKLFFSSFWLWCCCCQTSCSYFIQGNFISAGAAKSAEPPFVYAKLHFSPMHANLFQTAAFWAARASPPTNHEHRCISMTCRLQRREERIKRAA